MVCAAAKAALCQLLVAWIFAKYGGEDGGGHVRADAVIGERSAETFSVSVPALSPGFWIIPCLRDSRESTVEGISAPVEDPGGCQPEFLSRSKELEGLRRFRRCRNLAKPRKYDR